MARAIESELKRVPDTRNVYSVGDTSAMIRVELDPGRLAAAGLTAGDLAAALQGANLVRQADAVVGGNHLAPVQAGQFLANRDEVAAVSSSRRGRASRSISMMSLPSRDAPRTPSQYAWFGTGAGRRARPGSRRVDQAPAVTIAISKKPGENAIDVATAVINAGRTASKGIIIPTGVEVTVTRNYGVTANDKAHEADPETAVRHGVGRAARAADDGPARGRVVGAAVIVTLAATLFASWAWGFTINRVSLFALIFAIGILVDDAIVIVENIHRHLALDQGTLSDIIPTAPSTKSAVRRFWRPSR